MSKLFDYMRLAIQMARQAIDKEEIPVGAVLVKEGTIIAQSHNLCITTFDPTAHAEMLVIRSAAQQLQTARLENCDLYVTLEPCAMCAQAIAHARIRRLIFGAYDPKGGGVEHGPRIFQQTTCHHQPEIFGGIMEQECAQLLKAFFLERRDHS